MSLALPLAVRLKSSMADRYITRDLHDLSFRSAAPGGFASATFQLDRPLALTPDDIDYYAEVYVYDQRSGAVVWEGRLEDLGRSTGDGEIWEVQAVGPAAHAQDRTVPLIYVDESLDQFVRFMNPGFAPGNGGEMTTSDDPGNSGNDALVLQYPSGQVLTTDSHVTARYNRIAGCGQKLARIVYTCDMGVTTGNFGLQLVLRPSATTVRDNNFNTAGVGATAKVVVTDWTNSDNAFEIRLHSNVIGAWTIGDNNTWASIYNLRVLAMRYNKSGTEITSYTVSYVTASDVVEDLLGRLLTKYDGANATVAGTSAQLTNVSYFQGVDAAQVLEDMMLAEPAYYWAAWESNSAGKHRFEWKSWPTTVRYETDADNGFSSPTSADDMYNAVQVLYLDRFGLQQTTRRTRTVNVLTAAGLTRETVFDIRDRGRANLTYAQAAGDIFLSQHGTASSAGTLTVAERVRDLATGEMVMPWEIIPGELIRVRGVVPSINALNATDRDAVSIFRIVANEFRASAAASTLELDTWPLTVARALAKLMRQRGRPSTVSKTNYR